MLKGKNIVIKESQFIDQVGFYTLSPFWGGGGAEMRKGTWFRRKTHQVIIEKIIVGHGTKYNPV